MTAPELVAYRAAYNAAKTPADRLRVFYGLPADVKRGRRVTYRGRHGVITAFSRSSMYIYVRLDGDTRSDQYHPLDLSYPPIGAAR